MRLYHFTCLFHLPDIMREGIAKGEMPVSPWKAENAPNFTTNSNGSAQHWKEGSGFDKCKVRIAVDVPEDDRLEPWRKANVRFKVDRSFVKALDQYGQGKFWWLFWGVVPTTQFVEVAVREDNDRYRALGQEELTALCQRINVEKKNFDIAVHPTGGQFAAYGPEGSWLCDA